MLIDLAFVHPHPAGWQHPQHGTTRKVSWTDCYGKQRESLAVDYYQAPDEPITDALAENYVYYGNRSKSIIYRHRLGPDSSPKA